MTVWYTIDDPRVPADDDGVSPGRRSVRFDALDFGEPLGQGGSAVVYSATDTETDQQLAVKLPKSEASVTRDTDSQFLTESKRLAKLDDHRHIVGVVDWRDRGGMQSIAMEYMDGKSLRNRLDTDHPDLDEAIWIGIAIASAVWYAHSCGVAHLDLKPANVLFRATPAGSWDLPKVSDWGLSKNLIDTSQEIDGQTPRYAAPEQFDPDAFGELGNQTDVYQLGAILYELLTEQPVVTKYGLAAEDPVKFRDPEPPQSVNPDVPSSLDDLVMTALEKDQRRRHEAVLDIRRGLEEAFVVVTGQSDSEPSGRTTRERLRGATTETRPSENNGNPTATLHTNKGDITVELFEDKVPNTVENFIGLATGVKTWVHPETDETMEGEPLYEDILFHRIIDDFMIQCGDPTGTGRGGPGYTFDDEFHPDLDHDGPGVLSMANRGPDTNGSQFFITLDAQSHLDGKHAVFGKVTDGMDVVEDIGSVSTDRQDKPVSDVVLESVDVVSGNAESAVSERIGEEDDRVISPGTEPTAGHHGSPTDTHDERSDEADSMDEVEGADGIAKGHVKSVKTHTYDGMDDRQYALVATSLADSGEFSLSRLENLLEEGQKVDIYYRGENPTADDVVRVVPSNEGDSESTVSGASSHGEGSQDIDTGVVTNVTPEGHLSIRTPLADDGTFYFHDFETSFEEGQQVVIHYEGENPTANDVVDIVSFESDVAVK